MKMFGKLTRDKFEWHPAKLLCKRFNIPEPYPGSTIVGLPKVKRDKYSVFNFLTVPETPSSKEKNDEREAQPSNADKTKKQSRWDLSAEEKKNDSINEFLSLARSEIDVKQKTKSLEEKEGKSRTLEQSTLKADEEKIEAKEDEEAEESRPSIDLFKAIFASSSDEKSSSSDDDSEEEELPVELSKAKNVEESLEAPLPDFKDLRVVTKEPAISVLPPSTQNQESDSDDAFGPKLPPISSFGATRTPAEVQVVTSTQSLQKHKLKKNKEKHKTKKDHKHKKEKKKKSKKHKHKSKQKKIKNTEAKSSTGTSESSDESGPEVPTEISPRELLKRLKRLSDSR